MGLRPYPIIANGGHNTPDLMFHNDVLMFRSAFVDQLLSIVVSSVRPAGSAPARAGTLGPVVTHCSREGAAQGPTSP
jgi:hypothetical protein